MLFHADGNKIIIWQSISVLSRDESDDDDYDSDDDDKFEVSSALRTACKIIYPVLSVAVQKPCAPWGMQRHTFWAHIALTATWCTPFTEWNSTSAADPVFNLRSIRAGLLLNVRQTWAGRFRRWTALVREKCQCTCNFRFCQAEKMSLLISVCSVSVRD